MEDTDDIVILKNNSEETYSEEVLDAYDHKLIFRIYLEIYTIVSLLCIILNVFVIFVICKYRRLRHEKSNVILLHWAIFNILLMIISPMTFRFAVDFAWIEFWSYTSYCVVEHMEYTALLASMLMMVMMTMFWFLKLYYQVKFEKFTRHLTFFIAGVYIVYLLCLGVHLSGCIQNRRLNFLSELVLIFTYLLYFAYMIVINLIHLCKRRFLQNTDDKRNIPLLVSNVYFASFFPFIIMAIIGAVEIPPYLFIIFFCTCMLMLTFSPIYIFIVLYKFDKNYHTFFKHILTCRCREYSGDEMSEQPVVYSNQVEENKC